MDETDKQKILSRYAERINTYGHGAAALGEPKQRQAFYFDMLAQVEGFQPGDSVVDIGCGYGDLGSYLQTRGWRGQYVGVDINPQLIEEGQRRYPGADLRVVDIQGQTLGQQFDWCICCHALTSITEAVPFLDHLQTMLNSMWACCRKGLVFNLLSPLADYTHPVHARPAFADVLAIMNRLTNRFTLRHDYMPFEYAIYAYKDNAIRRDLLIFEAQNTAFADAARRWRAPVDSTASAASPVRTEGDAPTSSSSRCVLVCQQCGTESPGDRWQLQCPTCGKAALLATRYAEPLRLRGEVDRFSSYADWLPYDNRLSIPGPRMATIEAPALAATLGIGRLWVAISGHAPHLGSSFETGTFKECEAIGVLNRVREQTRKTLIVSSAGNAGRAFLELSAQYREPVIVVMPASARPRVKRLATDGIAPLLVLIEDSIYPDAIRFVDLAIERFGDDLVREGGCFNVARRDSMGVPFLRAVHAIGHLPGWYVQAVGSGTGAIAAWESARRLIAAGAVAPAQMRLLLVQNAPFAPMVDAWQQRARQIDALPEEDVRRRLSQVAARVLSNATPPYVVAGGVYDALVDSAGEMVAVDNAAVFAAQEEMARAINFHPCEAAAAAYAGLKDACTKGLVGASDEVLLHLTGGGLDALRAEGAVQVPPAQYVQIDVYDAVFETIRQYLDSVRRVTGT